ncbi:MAG: GDP-L-fucose synthase [Candidatus Omnitrophica bacterium]|nr:GDP-L-fucose synthase [Candidatus Omnitrophota bacterium]
MVNPEEFPGLKAKSVLVTGADGFLGGHLVRFLKEIGVWQLIAPARGKLDLTRESEVEGLFRAHRVDLVIHCAALNGGIEFNIKNQGEIFFKNTVMNALLMEHSRRAGVQKFISTGTVDSYPKFAPMPLKEEDLWEGYPEPTCAPYAFSKKTLLVQGQAYREQYGFNAVHLLLINLYGPGDDFDLSRCHVIPALIQRMDRAVEEEAESIQVWGDGSQRREFLHVRDAARAVLLAAEHDNDPEPVNVGSGQEISIRELVERIRLLVGFRGQILWDTSRPGGHPRKCFDLSRAKERFHFLAQEGFEEGLRETLDWYRLQVKPGKSKEGQRVR